jgi:hypothetical protein
MVDLMFCWLMFSFQSKNEIMTIPALEKTITKSFLKKVSTPAAIYFS